VGSADWLNAEWISAERRITPVSSRNASRYGWTGGDRERRMSGAQSNGGRSGGVPEHAGGQASHWLVGRSRYADRVPSWCRLGGLSIIRAVQNECRRRAIRSIEQASVSADGRGDYRTQGGAVSMSVRRSVRQNVRHYVRQRVLQLATVRAPVRYSRAGRPRSIET